MKFKRKKNVKMRGTKTHGHGSKKKWRGSGNKGGKGMAGSGKRADQKKTYILRYFGNEYYGKRGFHSINKKNIKIINLDKLNNIDKEEINLKELGYTKLLGRGNITKKVKVHIEYASKSAIEKIKEKGGEVILN